MIVYRIGLTFSHVLLFKVISMDLDNRPKLKFLKTYGTIHLRGRQIWQIFDPSNPKECRRLKFLLLCIGE